MTNPEAYPAEALVAKAEPMSDADLAERIVAAWCGNLPTDGLEIEVKRRGTDWNDIKAELAELTESAIECMDEDGLDAAMAKAARGIEALFHE